MSAASCHNSVAKVVFNIFFHAQKKRRVTVCEESVALFFSTTEKTSGIVGGTDIQYGHFTATEGL